LNDVESPK